MAATPSAAPQQDIAITRRAEEIREQTGIAWEHACRQAERERDAAFVAAAAPRHERRTTTLDDGSRVETVVLADRKAASLTIVSTVSCIQIGVCMSREQLVAHRDAVNAVLVSTEPEPIPRATLEAAVHAGVLSPDALEV